MVYGTPFEQLEDEEKSAISKRPQGIQDEVVTDERGRRRFHGAFTGGFSAGYFNTAGSKHGWVPQTFKSSREDRAEKTQHSAEDYMDDEDLGEFGIAARKLRPKVDFMDSILSSAPGEKRLLAWERSSTTADSGTSAANAGSLEGKLTEMLRPINDSVGVRLLKKMGWRPGKGIGMKMSRRELERQKVTDAKSAGRLGKFDEDAVQEVENYLQNQTEFSPDDIAMVELKTKNDVHGMGYKPLQESGVLSQKYGIVESALKLSKKSKGIRGQAFGVGAFEEDDEDIYTNYDLTQYDFEVGTSSSTAQLDVPKFDSTFVPADASVKRGGTSQQKFFVAPQPPPGWRPHPHRHKAERRKDQPLKLPESVVTASERLTPFQRAKLLGERDHSVMEMLSLADRERLKGYGTDREREQKRAETERRSASGRRSEAEPFEEEPMKAHRFKQYVNYLKRGIPFPQPVDMTRLEWEQELAQFQEALTPELRALLPEVRDRQKPLAKIDFALPIAEHLKSRFEKETGSSIEDVKHQPIVKDERVEAVQQQQFGKATRQKYEWHPARDLCKRFNVPNPYPDSQLVGAPGLGRRTKRDYSAQYSLMDLRGLRDTAAELSAQRRHHQHHQHDHHTKGSREDRDINKEVKQEVTMADEKQTETVKIADETTFAPMELLSAIFGGDESEEEENNAKEMGEKVREEEEEEEVSLFKLPKRATAPKLSQTMVSEEKSARDKRQKVLTVLDLVEDDDLYGPALPPSASADNQVAKNVQQNGGGGAANPVITVNSSGEEEENWQEIKETNKDEKKRTKERRKKHSKKKEKKAKKERRKRNKEKRQRRRHSSAEEEEGSSDSLSSSD